MKNIKVSIITATYNSEDFILDTYQGILNQTCNNWEWLITDDCSSDKTLSILAELVKKDPRVKCFKNNKNSGAAKSRNNSIKHATGEFLAFVDSDDIWTPDKLEVQLGQMEAKQLAFSFTGYSLITEQGEPLEQTVDKDNIGFVNYEDMLKKKATLGCSTVILKIDQFNKEDLQMPDLRTGQDYAFWLKLLKEGANAYCIGGTFTLYRIVSNSISRNKFKKSKRQWLIYRRVEKLGFIKSSVCFMFYAYRAIFRC